MIARTVLSAPNWLVCIIWLAPSVLWYTARGQINDTATYNSLSLLASSSQFFVSIVWSWALFSLQRPYGWAAVGFWAMFLVYPAALTALALDATTIREPWEAGPFGPWVALAIGVPIGFGAYRIFSFERRSAAPLLYRFAVPPRRYLIAMWFFAIAFLPIGIWFIKPRVKQMMSDDSVEAATRA